MKPETWFDISFQAGTWHHSFWMNKIESSLQASCSRYGTSQCVLQVCDALRGGWAEDTVAEFSHLSKDVMKLEEDLDSYRATVSRAKQDLILARSLLCKVSQLSAQVAHMKANLPTHLNQHGAHSPVCDTHSKKQTQVKKEKPSNNNKTTTGYGKVSAFSVLPKHSSIISYFTLIFHKTASFQQHTTLSFS